MDNDPKSIKNTKNEPIPLLARIIYGTNGIIFLYTIAVLILKQLSIIHFTWTEVFAPLLVVYTGSIITFSFTLFVHYWKGRRK